MGKKRLQHLRDSVLAPGWRVGTFIALDLVGALLTLRDEVAPDFLGDWKGVAALRLTWDWWAIATLSGLILVLFEGSFRVRCRVEQERDAALTNLADLAAESPLIFVSIETKVLTPAAEGLPSEAILGVDIHLANDGDKRIRYDVRSLKMRGGGVEAKFLEAISTTGNIPAGRSTEYMSGSAITPLPTAILNGSFEVEFEIAYDTIPATRRRVLGRHLKVLNNFIVGPQGVCDYLILREWDE